MMPPGLAAQFTVGERAALYVVATEVKRRGQCDLYNGQIAAFAGVGDTTCRNAVRTAKRLGLIEVDNRPIGRCYNDANKITIVSREWRAWLAHGRAAPDPRQKETVKNATPTYQPKFQYRRLNASTRPAQAAKPQPNTKAVDTG
jgi:hypothetical protein